MIRPMGQFQVIQRTKDGMFNATALIKQWNNNVNTQNSGCLKERQLDNFWKISNLDQLMSEIALNELNFKSVDFTELKNVLSKTSKGKDGGTWMHPILFVKFAMWLNPRFEYHVLKFVADQMIKYRNDAGDAYRELSSAVATIVPRNEMKAKMRKVGEAVNWVIFNAHEKMLRNKEGDEHKQRELWMFEKKVATLINEGFIRNYDGLIGYLRRQWQTRNTPQILASL